ncbi:MAG TPA: hypothetical protein VGI73_00535 [Solirubrobacterales bacterium]
MKLEIPLTPALEGSVEALLGTPATEFSPYRERLENLLRADAHLSLSNRAGLASNLRAPPQLKIAEDVAEITLEPVAPILWRIPDPTSVRLQPMKVPPGVRLKAVLHAADFGVDAATPLPLADDGDANLRWSFGPGTAASAGVTLRHPLPVANESWTQEALYIVAAILPMAIFAALVLLIPRRRRADLLPTALIALGAAAVGISLALYFVIIELQILDPGVVDTIVGTSTGTEFLKAFVPGLGVAAFACLVPGRKEERAIRAVLALVMATVLAISLRLLPEAGFGTGSTLAPWALEAISGLAAVLLLGLVVGATVRWLDFAWAATGRGDGVREKLLGRTGEVCIAAVTVLVAGGQLILAVHLLDGSVAIGPQEVPSLQDTLAAVPFILANLCLNLAAPIFALALAIWLWQQAGDGELPLESRWEALAIALVFATIVIGITGGIDGYPAPFPFFASFLSIAGALLLFSRGARAALVRTARSSTETDRMLDRWLALKRLMKRGSGAAGEPPEEDQTARRSERAELIDLAALREVPAEDRPRTMLELGLGDARSATERLRLAAQRGWFLVAAPVAYSALLLVEQQGAEAISSGQPFGLVFLATGIFTQSTMWVVAAALFLLAYPLLPGRVGALKGLLTGVFVGLPWVLVQLLNGGDTSLHTTYFIPAVLTLLFVAFGSLLDYCTVRRRHEELRDLGVLYSLGSARSALAAASVLVLVLTVIQGLANGEGAAALGNAATKLPGF